MFSMTPEPFFNVTLAIGSASRQLSVMFRHMTRTQFRTWQRRAVEISAMPMGEERDDAEAKWLAEAIKDWGTPHRPIDASGAPVAFSVESLQQLLELNPSAGSSLFNAYEQSLFRPA